MRARVADTRARQVAGMRAPQAADMRDPVAAATFAEPQALPPPRKQLAAEAPAAADSLGAETAGSLDQRSASPGLGADRPAQGFEPPSCPRRARPRVARARESS